MIETVLIPPAEMKATFQSILLQLAFDEKKAAMCAEVFTANSIDGVYTHGVNRFPVFVQYVKDGFVDKDAEPALHSAFNGMEQWNGNGGPGPLNAIIATERAMQLAQQFGIGCVAMANTNHWMRAGYYGWQAARKGFVFIAWTNTTALMPAWGATDARLGNNPLVMAVPFSGEAIVLDTAMSQYSFGAMEQAAARGEMLKVVGGHDSEGRLTNDAAAILQSRRGLPIGYWKGAGLSLLLDILAAVLSGGLATHQITAQKSEHGVSQVFICMDVHRLNNESMETCVRNVIDDYKRSAAEDNNEILYPGERVLRTREKNLQNGVPVLRSVWEKVVALSI